MTLYIRIMLLLITLLLCRVRSLQYYIIIIYSYLLPNRREPTKCVCQLKNWKIVLINYSILFYRNDVWSGPHINIQLSRYSESSLWNINISVDTYIGTSDIWSRAYFFRSPVAIYRLLWILKSKNWHTTPTLI